MTSRIITDISNYIFISDTPAVADAIFLPGGMHPQQPEYAARLYLEGYAKWIIPSGKMGVQWDVWPGVADKADIYTGDYRSECELFVDVLTKSGVPRDVIIPEYTARHTRDNAFLSRKAVDEKGLCIKTAIIVCKEFHARRCLMLYQLAFPEVTFKVCPINCSGITKENWYKTERGINRVFGELERCGNQFVGDIKDYLLTPACKL